MRFALFLIHYLVVGFVFITQVNDKHNFNSIDVISILLVSLYAANCSRPETLLLLIIIMFHIDPILYLYSNRSINRQGTVYVADCWRRL